MGSYECGKMSGYRGHVHREDESGYIHDGYLLAEVDGEFGPATHRNNNPQKNVDLGLFFFELKLKI